MKNNRGAIVAGLNLLRTQSPDALIERGTGLLGMTNALGPPLRRRLFSPLCDILAFCLAGSLGRPLVSPGRAGLFGVVRC